MKSGLTFVSGDEILKSDHSNKGYGAGFLLSAVYFSVSEVVLTFDFVDENLAFENSNDQYFF